MEPRTGQPLVWTLAQLAALWSTASIGYNILLPGEVHSYSYVAHPFLTVVYYLFWISVTLFWFRDFFSGWQSVFARRSTYVVPFCIFVALCWFYGVLLPHYPMALPASLDDASAALLLGEPAYLVSKGIEILFQQILIFVLVKALAQQFKTVWRVALAYAFVFSVMHLLLLAQGESAPSVAVFTTGALISSLFFPYCILELRNGLLWSYSIHWAFYALVALVARF